jgi:hypothetical protein
MTVDLVQSVTQMEKGLAALRIPRSEGPIAIGMPASLVWEQVNPHPLAAIARAC